MASGGCGPPLPPSGKSDKGKGKKSYVVKLMERFNNEIGSSSQPTTPTSTSTGRSVPSQLQVPGFTPTSHTSTPTSLPSPLQVPGLTPTPYQVPTNQMAALSPNGDDTWNALLEKWNMPLYRQKCETTKKNRTSEKGGCFHTGGSISVHEHAIRLSQELGRSVHVDEIFQQTHIRQSAGEFVDESPLDPTDEERLRNRCWLEAAGGK
ncbi:hypothetical protein LR48_Vigan09g099400 [Vigna angularis]|uniref:Uncharacterized protein n=1 Tax=Phaseolus angularis TaxID=3914 RepID=A0A0L9VB99_PHAAN|nr:hypothetical protein LR48_Vigan09g099400 [Vigna angularis]